MVETNSIVAVIVAICYAALPIKGHEVPLRGYECKQNAQQPCRLCEPGHYCQSETNKQSCGRAEFYCPLGSVLPTKVTDGYYTVNGADDEHRSDQKECEPGFYCSRGKKEICPAGYYCPDAGMGYPTPCGDANKFCKEGSTQPEAVKTGYYSVDTDDGYQQSKDETRRFDQKEAPLGYYAKNGLLFECPEGHYGDTKGLSDDHCSGVCEEGWYCPKRSTSPR